MGAASAAAVTTLWCGDSRPGKSAAADPGEIPEELKEEVQNLNRRYLTPSERTFPVAVQFLVPEEML